MNQNLPTSVQIYAHLLHPEGKKILADLESRFGTDAPAFLADANGAFDTHRAAIRDGQRQVILHIRRALTQLTHEQPKKSRKAKTD